LPKFQNRHGLRWQSEAVPPPFGRQAAVEGGKAVRFPPQSKTVFNRISAFGFLSDFGFRISDFIFRTVSD